MVHTTSPSLDIQALQTSWMAFDSMAHVRPIHTEADFERMVELMNSLLADVGDNEDHPISSLLDLVSDLVSRYEQLHHAIAPAQPKDTLRFLMDARGLKQEALSSLVAQSNLSAILAGKRKISATLAGKLGKFFGINATAFLPLL